MPVIRLLAYLLTTWALSWLKLNIKSKYKSNFTILFITVELTSYNSCTIKLRPKVFICECDVIPIIISHFKSYEKNLLCLYYCWIENGLNICLHNNLKAFKFIILRIFLLLLSPRSEHSLEDLDNSPGPEDWRSRKEVEMYK